MAEWLVPVGDENGAGVVRYPGRHIPVELERGAFTPRFDDARIRAFARTVAMAAAVSGRRLLSRYEIRRGSGRLRKGGRLMVTRNEALSSLGKLGGPETGVELADLGLIRDVQIADSSIRVKMVITIPRRPLVGYPLTQAKEEGQSAAGGREFKIQPRDEPWEPTSEVGR